MTAQPYDLKVNPVADPDAGNPGSDTDTTEQAIRTVPGTAVELGEDREVRDQ